MFVRDRTTQSLTFRALVLLLTLVLGASCDSGSHAPDTRSTRKLFPPSVEQDPRGDPTTDIDVYVDGSESMKGFARATGSNFMRVLTGLLRSAQEAKAQFTLHLYKLASTVSPVPNPLELQSPNFYSGGDTPLADLLVRISKEPAHTAIIITDMVQSERGTDSSTLAGALAQLANQRPQMRLLGYRSHFDGDYFPENRTADWHGTIQLSVSQSLPGSGRPFYILVVAPNEDSMTQVDKFLLSRFPPVHMFNPTERPIIVDRVDLLLDDSKDVPWSIYSHASRDATGKRVESTFLLKKANFESRTILPLGFTVQFKSPIRAGRAGQLSWEVTKATWRKNQFGSATEATIPIEGDLEPNGTRIRVRLTLQNPEPDSWDTYRVKMRAGDANLDVPAWVNDWNTDDDNVVGNGNRTYQLEPLVEAMTIQISEKIVFCEYILAIGRKG
jgi:hypothetical protein